MTVETEDKVQMLIVRCSRMGAKDVSTLCFSAIWSLRPVMPPPEVHVLGSWLFFLPSSVPAHREQPIRSQSMLEQEGTMPFQDTKKVIHQQAKVGNEIQAQMNVPSSSKEFTSM